jgi:hypothetical protein
MHVPALLLFQLIAQYRAFLFRFLASATQPSCGGFAPRCVPSCVASEAPCCPFGLLIFFLLFSFLHLGWGSGTSILRQASSLQSGAPPTPVLTFVLFPALFARFYCSPSASGLHPVGPCPDGLDYSKLLPLGSVSLWLQAPDTLLFCLRTTCQAYIGLRSPLLERN